MRRMVVVSPRSVAPMLSAGRLVVEQRNNLANALEELLQ